MNVFRSIDKVLAGLGNIRAMERLHVDTFTEDLIKNIEGEKIAESQFGQIFISYQELAGYEFMNTVILSATNIKTFKGAKLVLIKGLDELEIPSDDEEIESDFSNVSNRYMTKVSFIVDEEVKRKIDARDFEEVRFQFKKKIIHFDKVE